MNITEELQKLNNWVVWRKGNKTPINALTGMSAKSNDINTWCSFDIAKKAVINGFYDGVGFMFNDNGIVGIDLDHCIDENGAISQEAYYIISRLNSYTEVSQSGTGIHIFCKGTIPKNLKTKNLEMYKDKRYFAMTGNIYQNLITLRDCTDELSEFYKIYANLKKNNSAEKDIKALKNINDDEPISEETARIYIKSKLIDYLQSKGIDTNHNFSCVNPLHEDLHPSMYIYINPTDGLPYAKCASSNCNVHYDTFDCIGIFENLEINNYAKQFQKAVEIFNITIEYFDNKFDNSRDYDIDFLKNILGRTCDNAHTKYIFLTGDKRLTEKLFISERSIAVTLSDTFSIETLVQTMLKGIYARDYYYIPLCDKKTNNALINTFTTVLGDIKFTKNAYTIFKGKSMDYFLQSENFEELQKNLNEFLDKIEGKERLAEFDFNSPIFIENNCYTKQVIKNNALVNKKISNFIIIPIEQIMQDENNALIKIKLLKSNGVEIIRIYPTVSFYKATEFKKVLNATTTGLYFKGNDEDLEDVKALFNEIEYPIKQGVKITGLQLINNKWVFAGENRTFNAENETLSDYVYLNETEMRNNIDTVEPITADEFKLINISLFQFNDIRKCMIILGFIGSCFIKEKLYKARQKLNHLFLIGQAGSGKSTTLENIIMPFFGVDEALKTSANGITRFTLLKKSSMSNTIPFFIDEFKPYEFKGNQKEWLSEILKNAYDRLPSSRGNIRQQINTYVPLTPIILCGESGFNETAITERAIQLSFSKKQLNDYNKTALDNLTKNKYLLTKLGRKLIDVALNISVAEVEQLHFKYYDLVEQSFEDFRVRKNVANILVGLEIFNKVYEGFGMQPINIELEFDAIVDVVKSDTLDDLNSSTSMVDETMQLIDTILAENITLTNMFQTEITADGQELLYLNVTGIYNYLYKYIKDMGLPFKPLPEKDFKKQLKDSPYCLDHICQKKFKFYDVNIGKIENINLRCFKLDLKILNEKLDLKILKIDLPQEFTENNSKIININSKKYI